MIPVDGHNRWLIWLSFCLAILLKTYPLPVVASEIRPDFLILITVYWVMVMPQNISLVAIWGLGCLQDLIEGAPVGQHALGLMVVAYVCLLSYQRMRNYTLWYQTFFVFVMVGLFQLVDNWVHSLQGTSAQSLNFLLPALTSAMIWPVAWMLMERLRISYRVT